MKQTPKMIRKEALDFLRKNCKKNPLAYTMHKWTSRTKSNHAIAVLFIHEGEIVNWSERIAVVCGLRYSKTKNAVLVWAADFPEIILIKEFNKLAKMKLEAIAI